MRGRVLEDAPESVKRAYQERMLAVLRQADHLEGEALGRAKKLTAEMQERVLGRIHREIARGAAQGDGRWNPFWLTRLQQAVDEVAREMAQRYGTELGEFLPKAWKVGADLVDAGFSVVDTGAGILPRISVDDVGIAANWGPDLITSMEHQAKEQIGGEIRVSMLTGESPNVLMKRLAGSIEAGPWQSVDYRAEIITRTETRRVQGLGAQKRMEQVNAEFPEVRLKKQLLVAEVNGYPCKTCREWADKGPWDVNDPAAPQVPLHPNCRCDMIPWLERLPDIDPAEKPTGEQRAASVADTGDEVQEAEWDTGIEPARPDGTLCGCDSRCRQMTEKEAMRNEFDLSDPPVEHRRKSMMRAMQRGMSREDAADFYGFPPDYDPSKQE